MDDQRRNSARKKDRRANRSLLRRTIFLMSVFGIVIFIPLVAQLWKLQIVQYDQWTERAADIQTRDVKVSASRGSIYDASGRTLAASGTVYKLILSPLDIVQTITEQAEDDRDYQDENGEVDEDKVDQAIEDTRDLIADFLVDQLCLDREKLDARMERTNSQYEVVAEELTDEEAQPIRDFISDNSKIGMSAMLALTPTAKRYYPQSTIASHLLGFMSENENSGGEKVGSAGLEALYDDELSGETGRVVTARTGKGFQMLSSYENYIDAQDGADLTLTIDSSIQSLAEQLLQEGIEAYDVQNGGFVIAMNPQTGAIYAMASSPDYDPNDYNAIIDENLQAELAAVAETYGTDSDEYSAAWREAWDTQLYNKALTDTYEPGSTFKPLVVAAALEEGVVSMDDTFYCGGSTTIGGHTIHCQRRTGHGTQTLTEAVENSCNCALM